MQNQQGCFKCYSLLEKLSSTTRSKTKPLPRDTPTLNTLKSINEALALIIEHSLMHVLFNFNFVVCFVHRTLFFRFAHNNEIIIKQYGSTV